jgi:OOP family OmpA-OmpF porin
MRKIFIVMALACITLNISAQEENEQTTQKRNFATNSFWSNWFIEVGADWNAWYSNEEHGQHLKLSKSPFKKFRSGAGMSVAIGKWFTPELGLRTKLQGFWGKRVDADNTDNCNKYWLLNEQALLNMSNLVCGYNPNRVWNVIPFVGGGVGRSMSYDIYSLNINAGLLNQFRVSRKMAINVEIGWNYVEGDIDGYDSSMGNRGWDSHDNNLYAEVGLSFNLGKSEWDEVPDVEAIKALSQTQIDALNQQLSSVNEENQKLRNMISEQKSANEENTSAVKQFITTPVSVFFNINKADIASQKDMVNVAALAKYARENNKKISVTGYADSDTGTPEFNKTLSEQRAKIVAEELVNLGISRDMITTIGNGGVNELSPVSFNRRATVQIAE